MAQFTSREEYMAFLERAKEVLAKHIHGLGFDSRSAFFVKNEEVGKILYSLRRHGLNVRDTGDLYLAWLGSDADVELAKMFYEVMKTKASIGSTGKPSEPLEPQPSIKQLINRERPSKLEYELRSLQRKLRNLEFTLDFSTDTVREIVEKVRRRPRRRTTSLYIDERLWEEFKRVLVNAGLGEKSAHRVLELLIAVFIDRYLRITESEKYKRVETYYELR